LHFLFWTCAEIPTRKTFTSIEPRQRQLLCITKKYFQWTNFFSLPRIPSYLPTYLRKTSFKSRLPWKLR
jgi:hypothetical protein